LGPVGFNYPDDILRPMSVQERPGARAESDPNSAGSAEAGPLRMVNIPRNRRLKQDTAPSRPTQNTDQSRRQAQADYGSNSAGPKDVCPIIPINGVYTFGATMDASLPTPDSPVSDAVVWANQILAHSRLSHGRRKAIRLHMSTWAEFMKTVDSQNHTVASVTSAHVLAYERHLHYTLDGNIKRKRITVAQYLWAVNHFYDDLEIAYPKLGNPVRQALRVLERGRSNRDLSELINAGLGPSKHTPLSKAYGRAPTAVQDDQSDRRRALEFADAGQLQMAALADSERAGCIVAHYLDTGGRAEETALLTIGSITWSGPNAGRVVFSEHPKRDNLVEWWQPTTLAMHIAYLRIDRNIAFEDIPNHVSEPLYLNRNREPISPRSLTDLVRSIAIRAGLCRRDSPFAETVTSHVLRKTNNNLLEARGMRFYPDVETTRGDHASDGNRRHYIQHRGDDPEYRRSFETFIFSLRELFEAARKRYEFSDVQRDQLIVGLRRLRRMGIDITKAPVGSTPTALPLTNQPLSLAPLEPNETATDDPASDLEADLSDQQRIVAAQNILLKRPDWHESLVRAIKLEDDHAYRRGVNGPGWSWDETATQPTELRKMVLDHLVEVVQRHQGTSLYRVTASARRAIEADQAAPTVATQTPPTAPDMLERHLAGLLAAPDNVSIHDALVGHMLYRSRDWENLQHKVLDWILAGRTESPPAPHRLQLFLLATRAGHIKLNRIGTGDYQALPSVPRELRHLIYRVVQDLNSRVLNDLRIPGRQDPEYGATGTRLTLDPTPPRNPALRAPMGF
jgi:hypothetical protein